MLFIVIILFLSTYVIANDGNQNLSNIHGHGITPDMIRQSQNQAIQAIHSNKVDIEKIQQIQKEAIRVARTKQPEVSQQIIQARDRVLNKGGKYPLNQSCRKNNWNMTNVRDGDHLEDDKKPLVFISSSMPRIALQELMIEARQHNARLVIRGMVNDSMKETAKFVKELNGGVEIDPKIFQKYQIRQVPVFLIPLKNKTTKKKEVRIVRGNVGLSYALQKTGYLKNNSKVTPVYNNQGEQQ